MSYLSHHIQSQSKLLVLHYFKSLQVILILFMLFCMAINVGAVTVDSSNANVKVRLSDAMSGEWLSDSKVVLYQRKSDGGLSWKKSAYTDAEGMAYFNIDFNGASYLFGAKVFNGSRSFSETFSSPTHIDFKVGKLRVKVVDGYEQVVTNYSIAAYEVIGEKYHWTTSGTTDTEGIIRFDLDDLGVGRKYVLKAKSPIDGSSKVSDLLLEEGNFLFKLGNQPLTVNLINAISQEPLFDVKVVAKEVLTDGSYKWRAQRSTDVNGQVVFDLDGLGDTRRYILQTKPYNGGAVYSSVLENAGEIDFQVGSVPVTVRDARNQQRIPNVSLTAYRKSSDGKLHWVKSGVSDENGLVRFDLPGLEQGEIYTIKSKNVFNQNRRYYSPWITSPGAVTFAISPDQDYRLDLNPPSLSVTQPTVGALVSDSGFSIKGMAEDDQSIDKVSITIDDPILGRSEVTSELSPPHWSVSIEPNLISSEQSVSVTVTAFDQAHNSTQQSFSVQVISDQEPPTLQISSHSQNSYISAKGTLISGTVADNTALAGLLLNVDDQQGNILSNQAIEISSTGSWTAVLPMLSPSRELSLEFIAMDEAGNVARHRLSLSTYEPDQEQINLLNRITFGVTPYLLDRVQQQGLEQYLAEQLQPHSVDDSELQAYFNSWQPESKKELSEYQLNYSLYSQRQLLEVMTWFWENHFNTDISKSHRVEYELRENQLFRQHALGYFKDLLYSSATSPAMMLYLDNTANRSGSPNENYAREVMELHTLGVDGGYTAEDVEELARVFTGWGVRERQFHFNSRRHDDGEKQVLGLTIPAGSGMNGGLLALDMLSSHPSTASFICSKLLRLLVSDKPEATDIEACAVQFLDSDGHIGSVLRHIFSSESFLNSEHHHSKFKTPLEFVTTIVRSLPIQHRAYVNYKLLNSMGMPLYRNPIPTGWSEEGIDWINSNQLMLRIQFVGQLAFQRPSKWRNSMDDPRSMLIERGYTTGQGIIGYLFKLLLDSDYENIHWQQANQILASSAEHPFDMEGPNAENKIRQLIAYTLSLPAFQLQ